jgi:hypothetical protein
MEHLPTVEASIRYWEAVRLQAIRARNDRLVRTALSLRLAYEAARAQLTTRKSPPIRRRLDQGKDNDSAKG